MNEELKSWLNANSLLYIEKSPTIFEIPDAGRFLYIKAKEGESNEILFDEKFHLILDEDEFNQKDLCDLFAFKFGTDFFYSSNDEDKVKLNPLKYLGKRENGLATKCPHLGIRGKYELLNGSRDYKDWCKKAMFLDIDVLGICEKNTLAGALLFQSTCKEYNIKSILGETVSVRFDSSLQFDIKLFVINEQGWSNLLYINKEINVINNKFISSERLWELTDGLVCILDPKTFNYDQKIVRLFEKLFSYVYFQFDTVIYDDQQRERDYLTNLNNFFKSTLKPVLINDAFYLDKQDSIIKQKLNTISGVRDYASNDQYFKSLDESFDNIQELFSTEDSLCETFVIAVDNAVELGKLCSFEIKVDKKHLPLFELTEDQISKFGNKEDLFWFLIEKGIEERLKQPIDEDLLYERVQEEFETIKDGGYIDYFLILWDILNYARDNNILSGMGRGSACGSLIAYLLYITHINPFDYNLLFSRFLNRGRLNSMPDIDTDFAGSRRDDIKRYMESKYGIDQVCSVGTYTTLQLKAAIKDLGRVEGVDLVSLNYATATIGLEDKYWNDLFKVASERSVLKKFIQDNPNLINDIQLCLGQPKSASIHACATLILPKEKTVDQWIPVRIAEKDGQQMIVSEWEGEELAEAGFLKEDILGIRQLDKFAFIIRLVNETLGENIDIYNLPLDEEGVYDLFKKGLNGDVFHFGSKGLTGYSKEVQPENINELITMIALYRPGAMESNFHNEYVLLKRGERTPEFDYKLRDVTKETFGLYCFQEQIMQAVQVLGGFTLAEADDVRRAMGKKKKSLLDSYKDQFIKGAIEQRCDEHDAKEIWNKLEKFAGYGFNKSHAAAYAVTGYISQYLKYKFPIQFWTAAFEFCEKEENIPIFVSEINKLKDFIQLLPPDINKSSYKFTSDYKTETIYWALNQIKQCGDSATQTILEERDLNGEFFSFADFLKRVPKNKVNKRVVENLIISGSFDRICEVRGVSDRKKILEKYYKSTGVKVKGDSFLEQNQEKLEYEWWWLLQQKRLSGLAYFEYSKIIKKECSEWGEKYIETHLIQNEGSAKSRLRGIVTGVVTEIVEKKSRKGDFCQVKIENNYDFIWVIFWSDTYHIFRDRILNSKDKILIASGRISYDNFRKENVLQTEEYTQIKILE